MPNSVRYMTKLIFCKRSKKEFFFTFSKYVIVSTKRGFLILDDVNKGIAVAKLGPIKCQESWKAKNPPFITFGNHKLKSNLTKLYS